MRQLGEHYKQPSRLPKIFLLTFALALTIFLILKFTNLSKLAFHAPVAVAKLVTDQGLKNDQGRVNVLLLGIGGDGHDGPNLTDTMIIASINKNTGDVALVNIPRDIWVNDIGDKINAVYAYGQEKNGTGLKKDEETLSKMFGIPIHYAFRIDFGGFEKAVDLVGGLDINVDTSFTDPMYPIPGKENDSCGLKLDKKNIDGKDVDVVIDATGSALPLSDITDFNNPFTCRFETLTFKAGQEHMDGTRALKFVRSRHGTNGEGSDFARSARQEKVLVAFRQKILSTKTLTDPKKVIDLISTFGNSIDTDITNDDVPLFVKLGLKIDKPNIRRIVLDSGENNSVLDVADPSLYHGAFALIPKNNDWQALQNYIHAQIYSQPSNSPSPKVQGSE